MAGRAVNVGKAGGSAFDVAEDKRKRAAKLLAEVIKLNSDADAWEQGAAGEQNTALELETLGSEYTIFHDLRIPGSKANIDHVVIGPTGVFVVDSKNHTGKITYNKGTLWSGKYPQTWKLDALRFEAKHVKSQVRHPVTTIMCFVNGQLADGPMLIEDIHVMSLRDLRHAIRSSPAILAESEAATAIWALRTPEQRRAHQAGLEADRKQISSETIQVTGLAEIDAPRTLAIEGQPKTGKWRRWLRRLAKINLGFVTFLIVVSLLSQPPGTNQQSPAPIPTQPPLNPSVETPFATTATMAP